MSKLILDPLYGYGFSTAKDPDTHKTVGFFQGVGGQYPGHGDIPSNSIRRLDFKTGEWDLVEFLYRMKLGWQEDSPDNQSWAPLPGETVQQTFERIYGPIAQERFAKAYYFMKIFEKINQKLKELS